MSFGFLYADKNEKYIFFILFNDSKFLFIDKYVPNKLQKDSVIGIYCASDDICWLWMHALQFE